MTETHTSTGRVGWGYDDTILLPHQRHLLFFSFSYDFRTGTDQAVYPPPTHSTPIHSVHAHCCLHSSGFTFGGGPPRIALPPRPAGRRGGGRASSSESSSSKFISEEIKKVRKVPYHPIKVVIVIVVIFIVVIVFIFREHVVFDCLAGEIVNSTRDDLRRRKEGERHAKSIEGRMDAPSP
jgi:hypothetical protein